MPVVTFIEHNGTERRVNAKIGHSLMQVALDNGVRGILADCGGSCACATCHGYIDPAWVERIPGPTEGEKGLLEFALEVRPESRLTCQVRVTADLDGLVVRLPATQG